MRGGSSPSGATNHKLYKMPNLKVKAVRARLEKHFGNKVKEQPEGTFKTHVDEVNNGDLKALGNLPVGADVLMKRSGTGITIIVTI